jgi:hypothetical protein
MMETEGGKRIERVEIFSHNDNVIFFRFYENNKEVIGLARCQSYKTFFSSLRTVRFVFAPVLG